MEYTLINGKVLDGTGEPGYPADVLIRDGVIAAVGFGVPRNGDVIDVSGKIVCPGFIDVHSHSGLAWFSEPTIDPKIHQGITTELAGVDGLSAAPIKSQDTMQWRTHLSGLDGNPPIEWSWTSLAEYLDKIPPTGPNPALMVGHGTIRLKTMGMQSRKATSGELQKMCEILRESLDAGAFGLSTGLVYAPCTYADREEMVALAKVLPEYGGFFNFHMRYEGPRVLESIQEVIDIGKVSGAAVHICHLKALGRQSWGLAGQIKELIQSARHEGIDITADQYPYTAASTMLGVILPRWLHAEGTAKMTELLHSLEVLKRIEREMSEGLPDWESFSAAAGWENIYISSVESENNQAVVGKNVTAIADGWGISPFEAAIRLLLEEKFAIGMVFFVMSDEDVESIMQAPWQMFATDGLLGGKPHPRVYGTYPRVLGHYSRDRRVLTLEEAVRKATSLPAQRLGLKDRGRISEGMAADIVVFDPATVIDRATYVDPRVYPEGMPFVFVNGEPAVYAGEGTGKRSGRILRRGR